jgi:glutaredoxin
MKKIKILFLILLFILIYFNAQPVFAKQNCEIYFFYANGCPHCVKENEFLIKLEKEYPQLKINKNEITQSKKAVELMKNFKKDLKIESSGVPLTIIGDNYLVGWHQEETTGKEIKSYLEEVCEIGKNDKEKNNSQLINTQDNFELPFLGSINLNNYSLPLITIIFGVLDGFNPCAMWVLLFLISILIGIKDKKKRWILGIIFIIASGIIYFIFMAAWLNLLIFLGFIVWIRLIIGVVAIIGGGINLKEFFKKRKSGCKVVDKEKRKKIFDRIIKISKEKKLILAIGGIILLAFSVNLIELICSAGLPAVYTQILTLNNLSVFQYYLFLLLYILFFILDDLLIFVLAMITLNITGISTKYARLSSLIGGILMIIIGILIIFKPEILMFFNN